MLNYLPIYSKVEWYSTFLSIFENGHYQVYFYESNENQQKHIFIFSSVFAFEQTKENILLP